MKIIKFEENRGLIDKKASEDQCIGLASLVLEVSHCSPSLSHSWTLRVFLEHFRIGSRKAKKARGSRYQERKRKIKQLQ